MKVVRIVAFGFTLLCLGAGALLLLVPVSMAFDTGVQRHEWNCGSAANPKDLSDFGEGGIEDATNCAGHTPAAAGLYAMVLAGIGVVAIGVTTWRIERSPGPSPAEVPAP